MFMPWDKPEYVTRIWCLWEVLCAIETGCEFDIALPPQERQRFAQAMVQDFDSIMQSLCEIDVANAKAREEADRIAILTAVKESVGVEQVNAMVMGKIRQWFESAALGEVNQVAQMETEEAAKTNASAAGKWE